LPALRPAGMFPFKSRFKISYFFILIYLRPFFSTVVESWLRAVLKIPVSGCSLFVHFFRFLFAFIFILESSQPELNSVSNPPHPQSQSKTPQLVKMTLRLTSKKCSSEFDSFDLFISYSFLFPYSLLRCEEGINHFGSSF
jgi:hypothetical protein